MKFQNLEYLWFISIIPLIIFFYIWAFRRKNYLIEQFVSTELKDRLLEGVSLTKQKLKILLIILGISFLIIALIRPKWGYHWEEIKREGVDIIVALDVSKSMLAEDVSPNRIERAKREIIDLLGIIQGDRVGLMAFAGTSFLQSPLTLDYGAVKIFLDDLDTDLIPIPGTAIADAIKKSVESFDQKDKKSRVLILITDGEDHSGQPIEEAKNAKEHGVKIYTIGIGKKEGAPIPDKDRGGFKKDSSGNLVLTHLDEETLQKIALTTGGSYVRSVTGDLDLEKIYADVTQKVETKELKSGKRKHFEERFQWPLLIAILLLMIELLLSERKSSKKIIMFFLFFSLNVNAGILSDNDGESEYKNENYSEALKTFLDQQIEDPNNLQLKYNTASTYYKLKDYEKAQKLFESTALYGDQKLAQKSFYNLGNTFFRIGKLQESIDAYTKALEIEPNDKDTKHNLEFVREEIKRRIEENKKRQE
ncbi:MAG: VWA domain-containing protein, partial [Bdellovibrionales bacterium]|nr:VWA domain-containing protein [Bdellovibrionales bacterium]